MEEEKISYGVFYKSKDCDKWQPYLTWLTSYGDAREEVNEALRNPLCIAIKIVERIEIFKDIAEFKPNEI